jgi:hypothetical protein
MPIIIKKSNELLILIILAAFTAFGLTGSGCRNSSPSNLNPNFEKQITSALNLHYLNTDTLYTNALTRVFNDTLVTYQANENPDSCFFFIQGLKNRSYQKKIYVKTLVMPCSGCALCNTCIAPIQFYKNGYIYLSEFGGSRMLKISLDGTITKLFNEYRNLMVYANKILFYQHEAIIISFNGIYVFDIETEKLLWKYNYDLNNGLSAVVDNNLVFTFNDEKDSNNIKTNIRCVNLDDFKIAWSNEIKNVTTYDNFEFGKASNEIFYNGNHSIIIPTGKAIFILNKETGILEWQYNWDAPAFMRSSGLFLDSNCVYFSTKTDLFCYSIKTHAKIWQKNNVEITGIYKNHLISKSKDDKVYIILNKSTGKVINKITNPFVKQIPIDFIGDYVLINEISLYN